MSLPVRTHYTTALFTHIHFTTALALSLPARTHYTATLPAHIHCTTDLALSLPARQTNATPYHRKCVHANHRPHASGDHAAYSAWPLTHAVQHIHTANRQDADSRARWLT
jgi:hypothetical protein